MDTYFVEKLRRNAEKYPDRLALALDFHQEPVTCGELWELSGRIYAFLKEKGLGREDFVLLLLPRSPKMFVAMTGVLRAGAAFLFMEDTYPEERICAIHKDLDVKFTLSLAEYEEAMKCSPLPGYEQTDPHDACFSFSTSGTTGKPKSMIHEYGKLDVCLDSWYADVPDLHEESPENFAMIFPFNFAAAFVLPLPKLYAADAVFILSYDTVKNLVRFEELLEKEQITEIYLSPSFLRTYRGNYHAIRKIIAAGEPATGVYEEGIDTYAYYGMSETCFMVTSYLLDRAIDRAVVGRNNFGLRILILDEDGNPVPQGETGEICYDNPYFRGYVNLPELNGEIRKYGIFHSRDLGYIDENENLVIRGRMDDMVKINGNRVEPMEIELTARKALGIEHPVARAFTGQSRSFVVLYYLKNEETAALRSPAEASRLLAASLPSYMIPTYYVPLDTFPTNANGKLSRKLLPEPDAGTFRSSYVKPETRAEEVFCQAMAEVLGLEQVGTTDDFFLIGGDSLTAIRLITACAEEGYFLTVNGLHECRTAAELARRFSESRVKSPEELQQENKAALQKSVPLTAGQKFQMELAMGSGTHQPVTYHVAMVLGLKRDVDTDRLKAAAERVIHSHPALLTRFRYTSEGQVEQWYDESLFTPVETVFMTEEEFARKKPKLTEPMNPFCGRLYRCQIISTSSQSYFFFDIHHLIADEMSSALFLRQVADCYLHPETELPPDLLYLALSEERNAGREESTVKMRAQLASLRETEPYGGPGILKPDLPGPETGTGTFFIPDAFRRSADGSSRMFLTACIQAVAAMNEEEGAMVFANYHGRDDCLKNDSVNCYVTPVPVLLRCSTDRSAVELMNDVRRQFDFGAAHCDVPVILENRELLGKRVMFNYRNGTMDIGAFGRLSSEVYLCPKPENQPNGLVIVGIVGQPDSDALGFYCTYPEGVYSENAIRRFYGLFRSAVKRLTEKGKNDGVL